MEKEKNIIKKVILYLKVNGKMIKKKEKEYIILIMVNGKVIDMKGILKMVRGKEKEYIIIMMAIDMKENTKMI